MAKAGKPKKAKASKAVDAPSFSRSINVDMDKAKNGYIVSSYRDTGSIKYIAKTKKEAMGYAEKLLRTK